MILMYKIAQQALIKQQALKQRYKPHLGLILLITFLFGMPTFCWVMRLNAALNQTNNIAGLENYSEIGDVF